LGKKAGPLSEFGKGVDSFAAGGWLSFEQSAA
jgi:hypothetical protein